MVYISNLAEKTNLWFTDSGAICAMSKRKASAKRRDTRRSKAMERIHRWEAAVGIYGTH